MLNNPLLIIVNAIVSRTCLTQGNVYMAGEQVMYPAAIALIYGSGYMLTIRLEISMHIPRIYRGCTKLISWRLQHWTTGGDLMFYLAGHVIRAWFLSLGFSRAGFLEIVALINGAQPPGAIEGGQSFHVPPLPVKVYKDCSPDFSSLLSSVSFVSAPYSSLPWLLLHYAPRTTQLQSHTPFEGFLAAEMVLLKQSGKFPYQLIALVMFIVIEHSRRALIYFSGLTGCTSGFRHLWCSEKSELLKPTEPLTGIYLNKG